MARTAYIVVFVEPRGFLLGGQVSNLMLVRKRSFDAVVFVTYQE